MLSRVEDYAQTFTRYMYSVCDQIQNPTNCFTSTRQKPGRGGGLKRINSCRKDLLPRRNSQRSKIHGLADRFSIDFSLLGLAYGGFHSQRPRFLFCNHKHLTKVLDFWFAVKICLKSIGRSGFSEGFLFVLKLFHNINSVQPLLNCGKEIQRLALWY